MGNSVSLNKINFEDMQGIITNKNALIINTLCSSNQNCLIKGTITAENESKIINEQLQLRNMKILIIIYGKNCSDNTIIKKYQQLLRLGFTNIYVYPGGMFEWLCLQDIYGYENFPTSKKELDILKYKGNKIFGVRLIENV